MIKDSGNRTDFSTGAVRDCKRGVGRMDLLPWYGIMEVSKHCEEGALKYGEHNVDKGIPLHSLLDSASRHLAKCMVGMDDEDHLRAACWNLLWALNQRVTHPELDDRFVMEARAKVKEDCHEPLVPVKCCACDAHFGIPITEWEKKQSASCYVSSIYGVCPACGEWVRIEEVKSDE